MKPVENLLLLTHASIALTIFAVLTSAMSQRSFRAIGIGFVIVRFFPAAADEQHVSDLDVAALRSGSDVNTLVFATFVKCLPRNWIVIVWIIINALFVCVASVIEQYSTPSDTVLSPVVDGTFMVC